MYVDPRRWIGKPFADYLWCLRHRKLTNYPGRNNHFPIKFAQQAVLTDEDQIVQRRGIGDNHQRIRLALHDVLR